MCDIEISVVWSNNLLVAVNTSKLCVLVSYEVPLIKIELIKIIIYHLRIEFNKLQAFAFIQVLINENIYEVRVISREK